MISKILKIERHQIRASLLSVTPGEILGAYQLEAAMDMHMEDIGVTSEHKCLVVIHQDTDAQHIHIIKGETK